MIMFNHIVTHYIMTSNIHRNMMNSMMRHRGSSVRSHSSNSDKEAKRYISPSLHIMDEFESLVFKFKVKKITYMFNSGYDVTYKLSENRHTPHRVDDIVYVQGFGNCQIMKMDEKEDEIVFYIDYYKYK